MPGALHRGTAKYLAKLFRAEPRQPIEFRIDQAGPSFELRRSGQRRLTVPRTDILAYIAAEHLPSDSGAEFLRECTPSFDGEIRNALGGVELKRSGERIGRAGIQTARPRAAT